MIENKNITFRTSWQVLTIVATVLLVSVFSIIANLQESFLRSEVLAVMALIGGAVIMTGGYVLTRRAHYEIFPMKTQVFGAIVNGILLSVCLFSLVSVLSVSLSIGLFLIAFAGAVEFLVLRTYQARKITLNKVFAGVLLFVSVYILGQIDSSVTPYLYLFSGVFLCKEILGRYTKIYLLSPWVLSIWTGMVITLAALGTIVVFPDGFAYAATSALSLPLWVGLLSVLTGVAVVMLLFLRRKIIIAKGYLQHKMQLWTLLLGFVGYFSENGTFPPELFAAFLLIILLYSVSEGSLVPSG